MKQHKWHKEIKAWADGAEIECRFEDKVTGWGEWEEMNNTCRFSEESWWEYRIKPQPKEPQYLYVYLDDRYEFAPIKIDNPLWQYIGKIKLEDDDGNPRGES